MTVETILLKKSPQLLLIYFCEVIKKNACTPRFFNYRWQNIIVNASFANTILLDQQPAGW